MLFKKKLCLNERIRGSSKIIHQELDIFLIVINDVVLLLSTVFTGFHFLSSLAAFLRVWHVQHNALSMGYLGNHQWGAGSPELQYFEAEVDYRFSVDFSILTIFNFVFSPRKQSPYCHLSSHIDVYGLGEARGAILPVKWMCNHNPFLEGYYPHFSALLHGRRRADGGK